jgi:hypothetical protein
MNRLLALAAVTLLSGFLISTADAGQIVTPAPGIEQGQVKKSVKGGTTGQVTEKKSVYSVEKEYKKRVEAKKKAMEMRKRMIRQNR